MMGVSEEKFWEMNPRMLRPYQRADEIRRERNNFNAWLSGLYTWNALQSALSGLGKKSKRGEYLKEPIPITEHEVQEVERRKMLRMKAQFGAFAQGLEVKFNVRNDKNSQN